MSVAPICYPDTSISNSDWTSRIAEWIPSAETATKIALGVLCFLVEVPVVGFFVNKTIQIMKYYGIEMKERQDIFRFWKELGELSPAFLGTFLKTFLVSYIVLIGPIFEEYVFRHFLYSILQTCVNDPTTVYNQIILIIGNGFVFGLAHLSVEQGWFNIPIFVATFMGGCFLTALREYTGDITASCTAHILHNGMVMLIFLLSPEPSF